MSASWSEVLDLYGCALDAFEAQLDSGAAASASFDFEMPRDVGPLPPGLVDHARVVQDRTARVEERVRGAMTQTAHERAAVTRARAQAIAARKRPAFVDVEA